MPGTFARRLVLLPLALGLVAALQAYTASAAPPPEIATVAPVTATGAVAQAKGRYKKQGDNCDWDANDTGPNQCTPVVSGRFKKNGDACTWDANDKGPDQCRPPRGRWAKDGAACQWRANDDGPDQCSPRQAR
jgi:hypothetical protein